MKTNELSKAFDIIGNARIHLDYEAYKKIWGEHLGDHIWFQEGTDLIRIWKSGLTTEQKESLLEYIINNYTQT